MQSSFETMVLPKVGDSICGEIFVTNNADKWTFCCSYCQKVTTDIGVFICHIRLEHLNSRQDYQLPIEYVKKPEEVEKLPFPKQDGEEANISLIKKESLSQSSNNLGLVYSKIVDISTLTGRIETENYNSNETLNSTYSPQAIKIESVSVASIEQNLIQKNYTTDKINESNVNTANNNDNISMGEEEDLNDGDTYSVLSQNDNYNDDNESNYDNMARGSKRKKETRLYPVYSCEYCDMNFKFRSTLDEHIKTIHKIMPKEIPLRCKYCKKFFRSVSGLKNHLEAHDGKNQVQCPICQAKHKQNYFISHVLTHESDNCFPCQVCGKIYNTNEERLNHWGTHANKMPFKCDFCRRRFRKQQYLIHHLKSHYQYQCHFCRNRFKAVESQRPPYICTTCEKVPDVKNRAQRQRLLANRYQVFNSDDKSLSKIYLKKIRVY